MTVSASKMAPYSIYSALLSTRSLWALVKLVPGIGNRVPFGTQPMSPQNHICKSSSCLLWCPYAFQLGLMYRTTLTHTFGVAMVTVATRCPSAGWRPRTHTHWTLQSASHGAWPNMFGLPPKTFFGGVVFYCCSVSFQRFKCFWPNYDWSSFPYDFLLRHVKVWISCSGEWSWFSFFKYVYREWILKQRSVNRKV
jgi:hypothetical protein